MNLLFSNTNRLRVVAWIFALLLLLAPLVAMQFTTEVNWSVADFALFALMLAAAGTALEFLITKSRHLSYQLAAAIAVLSSFVLVWLNVAVGLIGNENEPVNAAYFGVLAVGLAGALLTRLKAQGMYKVLLSMSAAQISVVALALSLGLAKTSVGLIEILILNSIFAGAWLMSAYLFKKAAGSSLTAS
jgi:hypothetical protein